MESMFYHSKIDPGEFWIAILRLEAFLAKILEIYHPPVLIRAN